eukprot:CAMPEP_0115669332 /NCGR_PEP_ID=MMETSP0272-20121206/50943_1 /TAXON_ID=71861 /ORGANISM="Scrippsiella trochoidea, Strain CCMP3099" /LENGTH=114 /DNA_ID=CAMNT_0003107991 /DNA_START=379 /DNA_END=724 /DNA_ORIENTATION=-
MMRLASTPSLHQIDGSEGTDSTARVPCEASKVDGGHSDADATKLELGGVTNPTGNGVWECGPETCELPCHDSGLAFPVLTTDPGHEAHSGTEGLPMLCKADGSGVMVDSVVREL